jgi:WD40 repeat protein
MSGIDEPTRGNVPEFRRGTGASPSRRGKRIAFAAIAVLAITLATAGAIIAGRPPPSPRGLVATLSGPGGRATCSAAFSPDGTTLAVAGCGDSIFLWDISARRWAGTLTSPRCPRGGPVVFSPDGSKLARFSGAGLTTCLWNLATRRETTLTDPGPRPYVAWTQGALGGPGGGTLAVADTTRDVYLWDLTAGRWTAALTDPSGATSTGGPNGGGVVSLAFARDGTLAVGDGDGRAYLWDVATGRLTRTIAPPVNVAQGNASISKDGGPYPAPGAFDHSVMAALSPDGALLAANVSFGYGTYLYDVATGKRAATLTDPGGALSQAAPVAFSPDGAMVAVTDPNGRTYLWRA